MGPEPFNGDWWSNSAEDVQTRACYFDDRYVFDQDGFHNDQGDETWLKWFEKFERLLQPLGKISDELEKTVEAQR